jgi:hypothetical protein
MAAAIERETRSDLELAPTLKAASSAAAPMRFLCGCRDCAFSRAERELAVPLADRAANRAIALVLVPTHAEPLHD